MTRLGHRMSQLHAEEKRAGRYLSLRRRLLAETGHACQACGAKEGMPALAREGAVPNASSVVRLNVVGAATPAAYRLLCNRCTGRLGAQICQDQKKEDAKQTGLFEKDGTKNRL